MALTANFEAELASPRFRGNVLISIDGIFYAQFQPDSGLVIDSDKLGIVDTITLNSVALDIRRANTPIATIGFNLLDKNAIVSTLIGASEKSLQNSEVKVYFGFRTGSFDFADYALLGVTRITNISKGENIYKFSSKESTNLMQKDLLNTISTLDGGINLAATSLTLIDATNFPISGRLKINKEHMQYTGKSVNTLTGLSRADLTSAAADHDSGDTVYLVTKKEAHILDILLDVLLNDLAIDPTLIDQTSITDLRDNDFAGDPDQVHYIYDNTNGLKWIESRVLESTNTRLFSVNGLITMGLLDQVPKFDPAPEINEAHTQRTPTWGINSDKIVNKIIVEWAFNEGTGKFSKTNVFRDTDSETIYDPRPPLTIKLYGVFSASIVSNRAQRLLGRFSTPKATIKLKTHFSRFGINIADAVHLTHRFLPQAGGTLGFSDTLEVMSKGVAGLEADSKITFGLEFSSYTGIRIGLISPSPKLDLTITDQKTFEVPDGTCYKVGYRLVLFDNINNIYFTDPVNIIESISGNFITMTDAWVTTLGANASLYFADYDNSNGDQRAQYAYIAPDTGIFLIDNSKAYQIIF